MLRDITIGQYYPTNSVIHKLDPRVKIVCTLAYLVSLFLFQNFAGFIVVTIFLIALIKISKVPFHFMVKGLKSIMVLIGVMVFFNLVFTTGTPLVQFWIITITVEGVKMSIFMVIRLTYLIIGASLMTLTTTPNNLTDGLEKIMNPLKKIKVPVHEIAMMMSIALRFIPILIEETDKIMKAQMARGADFENGNIVKRAKAMVPVLVPLFVSAFRRANDLALAMEARCYQGGEGRTRMKPLKYDSRDAKAYLIVVIYMVCVVLVGKYVHIPIGNYTF